jgi:hypothetical protein
MKHTTGNLVALHPCGRKEIIEYDKPWGILQKIKRQKLPLFKEQNIKLLINYTFTKTN